MKPGNVLVESEPDGERAYVCDFGVARHVGSVGSLTGDRGFVGTVDYVAPEQIRGEEVDGRADVYALGCVLFECVSGERPFERENELAVVFAHLNEPPPRVTDVRPGLAAGWDGVVARALAKEPKERYASCTDLATAASDAMHGRAMPSDRSRRRIAVAIAAVALAAVGAADRHGAGLPRRLSGGKDGRGTAARPPRPRCLHGPGARKSSIGHEVRLGEAPSDVVVAGRSAWLLLPGNQRLLRIDTRTHQLTRSFRLPWVPLWRLAAGNGFVWAAQDGGPELARISTATGRLERFRPGGAPSSGLAAGDRSLWVASEGELARIVPENGTAGRHFPYDGSGRLTFGEGALWSLEDHGVLRKLDPETGRVLARADLHATVSDMVVGGGLVWASVVPDGVVYGLDSRDLRVRRTFAVGRRPGADLVRRRPALGREHGCGWVTSVDPRSGARRRLALSANPTAAAYGNGIVWAGTVPAPPPLPPAGGPELRLSLPGRYLTLDPGLSHSTPDEQLQTATCAGLLTYADRNGPAGQEAPSGGRRRDAQRFPRTGVRTRSAFATGSASRRRRTSR